MNARELAALIWLGIFVAWALSQAAVRREVPGVLAPLVHPALAVPLLALGVYVAGLVYIGSLVGLWESHLITDTIVWFVVTGLALFDGSVRVFKEGLYKWLFLRMLGLTVVVEAFVNLYVFPLWAELVLLPFVSFLVVMSAFAESQDRYGEVKRLADGVLSVIGLVLFVYVAIRLGTDFTGFVDDGGWQRLIFPLWLTFGTLLGLVPLLGTWSNYSTLFAYLNWAVDDRRTRRVARLALVSGLQVRAGQVGAFNGIWCKEFRGITSVREARAVVNRFRAQRATEPPNRASIPASHISTASS